MQHKSAFIRYIRYEKHYSQHTIDAYTKDLEQYNAFLVECFPEVVSDEALVRLSHVRRWISKLSFDKLSSSSINRKISTLKSYYRFLLKKSCLKIVLWRRWFCLQCLNVCQLLLRRLNWSGCCTILNGQRTGVVCVISWCWSCCIVWVFG